MIHSLSLLLRALVLLVCPPVAAICLAQETQQSTTQTATGMPQIADEPKTIDPETLMPDKLAIHATVDLSDSSLGEVMDWLRDDQELVVLLNNNTLAEIDVLPSEPISDPQKMRKAG